MPEQITGFLSLFRFNAVVTLSMFFISFAVWLADLITRGKLVQHVFSTERASLLNPLTYLRFFTHVLGHRDWAHFSHNYLFMLILGPLVEEKYGSLNLLYMILITALVTSLFNFIVGKYRLCGASGVVFMLIVLSAFTNVEEHTIPVTLILVLIFYVVDEIIGIRKKDGVSHVSHLLGAVCGIAFGFLPYFHG